MGAAFALSSVAVPFFFGAAIGGVASGRVPAGTGGGDAWTSWTGPTSIMVGLLSVATGAYLAAVFMTGDAIRAGLPDLVAAFRRRAIGAGCRRRRRSRSPAWSSSTPTLPRLYDGLTSGAGLVMVIGSALAGAGDPRAAGASGRFEAARFGSAIAVGAVVLGWWLAQRPDFLPGSAQLLGCRGWRRDSAGPLLISVAVGMFVLVPSLLYLFRLTLRGNLDQEFHPIGASDPEEGQE